MNRKIRRIFSIILVACMLLSLVPLHATSLNEEEDSISNELVVDDEISTDSNAEESNNTEPLLSSEQEVSSSTISNNDMGEMKTSDETENLSLDVEKEIVKRQDILTISDKKIENTQNNNWELGMVFYDSSVNNGQTALESIDWDASNNSYLEGKTRQITMQINYAHYDSLESYNPGDITITVPNFFKDEGQKTYGGSGNQSWMTIGNSECLIWEHDVGANINGEEDYDWNCTFKKDDKGHISEYVFTNDIPFEEIVNFEGSIQISYILIPRKETPEKFDSECTHNFNMSGKANLTVPNGENDIESNELTFNYTRTYIHPWEYKQYYIQKEAKILQSYDGLPQGASDYIWVKYAFSDNDSLSESRYPEIYARDTKKKDNIPSECKVYNKNMELMIPLDENTYVFTDDYIYVAYPRNIYNKENGNLNITNKVELWGIYEDKTESEELAESSIQLNLSDYEIEIPENADQAKKTIDYSEVVGMQTDPQFFNKTMKWDIDIKAAYRGEPLTLKIEDTGDEENDCKITGITFPANIKNGNGINIEPGKYDCELWIKPVGGEYYLYESFKNPTQDKKWGFGNSNPGIEKFYFIIKDMTESFNGKIGITCYYNIYYQMLSGTVYNGFSIMINQKILQGNESYDWDIPWEMYTKYSGTMSAYKSASQLIKDNENMVCNGEYSVGTKLQSNSLVKNYYFNTVDESCLLDGFRMYDLLPYGVEITSSIEEIKNSLSVTNPHGTYAGDMFVNKSTKAGQMNLEWISANEAIKNTETEINITENWNGTGRTKVEIIGRFKEPIIVGNSNDTYMTQYVLFMYKLKFKISNDILLENGKILTNYLYIEKYDQQYDYNSRWKFYNAINDNGKFDKDAIDINDNGLTEDILSYASYNLTVSGSLSTHQGIAKYVKTDKQPYSIGMVETDLNSEYTYKLRITTGRNDVTNLILYDSLEEKAWDKDGNIINAYGNNKHWNGEFLGIDTSYAEGNNYKVKTYYSENKEAGNLYNEDGSLNDDYKEYLDENSYTYTYGEKQTITSPNWPNNYNANMTETKNYWEISSPGAEQLEITFDSTCRLESASYDYLRFYDKNGTNITSSVCGISDNKIGETSIAGKTYIVDGDYVKITMRTDSSGQYKGFSADIKPMIIAETQYATDKSKVKSLAFEYLDKNGNPAVIPKESVTYVEIKMKSPNTEYKTYAYNGCRSQWNVMNEFNLPVDGITGMHSNIVKVALPSSMEDKYINLNFNKIFDATDEDFEKLKLNKNDNYNFFISLTNQETGEVINGLLDSKGGFRVNNIPIGTYIIEEQNDIWFHFISMALMEPIEGIDFKEENGAYVITIGTSVESGATANIEVANKPDEERFYDSKYDIKNLFTPTM